MSRSTRSTKDESDTDTLKKITPFDGTPERPDLTEEDLCLQVAALDLDASVYRKCRRRGEPSSIGTINKMNNDNYKRKRGYDEITANEETTSFYRTHGFDSARNTTVKCLAPRKPKLPCAGFSVDTGELCGVPIHKRPHLKYPLCPAHARGKMEFALDVAGQLAGHVLWEDNKLSHPDNVRRRVAAKIVNKRLDHSRPVEDGRFYCFTRTDIDGFEGVKVGCDLGPDHSDPYERLLEHEKAPCLAEVEYPMVTKTFADCRLVDSAMRILLGPFTQTIACKCNQVHTEYYRLECIGPLTKFWQLVEDVDLFVLLQSVGE
ncbi:hypothetical protein BC832DRAFT_596148 [Gaertneriomyces semiglobifer]|nr:hypothetical protein BC832DRAFT_596148 [Gaertneriomyces semiglobifer]